MLYFILYLFVINGTALYLMYTDKKRAKRQQYRIPEKTLWTVALMGGALGATIGMEAFRHKHKHLQFKWGLPTLTLLDTVLLLYLWQ
jgi:uncharacterized membrane protein YsdA (DUF1294 family)